MKSRTQGQTFHSILLSWSNIWAGLGCGGGLAGTQSWQSSEEGGKVERNKVAWLQPPSVPFSTRPWLVSQARSDSAWLCLTVHDQNPHCRNYSQWFSCPTDNHPSHKMFRFLSNKQQKKPEECSTTNVEACKSMTLSGKEKAFIGFTVLHALLLFVNLYLFIYNVSPSSSGGEGWF